MDIKISVICPVYKAEAYLHQCIDSILAQTFTNFELLLIDDGSPDRSGEICDEYARSDRRIRVFHQENKGVGAARQLGIDKMKGIYSIHVDPDDYVDAEMLEKLYTKAMEEAADMLICDYFSESKQHIQYCNQKPMALNPQAVLDGLFHHLHGSLWNKLIRSDCYQRFQIRFAQDLNYCEDLLVNIQLLRHPIRISYLPKAFYHNVQDINPNSLSKVHSLQDIDQRKKLIELLKKIFVSPDEQCYIQHTRHICMGFIFNSGILSSKEFQLLFEYDGRSFYQKAKVSWIMRIFIFIACKGYYRLTYSLYIFFKRLSSFLY